MVDTLTAAERSARMARIKGKDSKPEMVVRRIVHAMGYRYRLHRGDLPGRPDLAFGPRKKAIFVHGCFWHQHADPSCRLSRMPKSRLNFWRPKLEANRARDERDVAALKKMGWNVLVVWECDLRDTTGLRETVTRFLEEDH